MTYAEYTEEERKSQIIVNPLYERMGWTYNRAESCIEFDLQVNNVYVEEKFRYNDYNDFLIEILQDVISFNPGWYYKTKAKRIFYWVENKKLYSVSWDKFKDWFENNWQEIDIRIIYSKKGYGLTLNISISWENIPENCYKKFIF